MNRREARQAERAAAANERAGYRRIRRTVAEIDRLIGAELAAGTDPAEVVRQIREAGEAAVAQLPIGTRAAELRALFDERVDRITKAARGGGPG